MDPQGLFIASLLDASGKGYAAGAVSRLAEREPALVEQWGFRHLVADTEVRMQVLAEALAAGSPELLEFEVSWMGSTYSARDLSTDFLDAVFACMREELEDSLPDDASGTACEYLDRAAAALRSSEGAPPSALVDGAPHVDLARRFLLAVLEGRRVDAETALLEACDQGASVAELHRCVLAPAQVEMGRLWQIGEVHAAEEHLASRVVEECLVLLRARMERAAPNGRTVLVASVSGNLHEIGARMVADHFELQGWRALFLGADTPTPDLVESVSHFDADLVALSAGVGLHVRATAELIAALRTRAPEVPVLVGGRPFSAVTDLWRKVGADGFAPDAESAVSEAERLVGRGSGAGS